MADGTLDGLPPASIESDQSPLRVSHHKSTVGRDIGHSQADQRTLQRAPTRQAEELDTCRICRGEATSNEMLFYPCKCSGSIKYVHQDCLMEWLSHSQKKYCELCKTPFRFTKLYHPQMPQSLPTSVFLKKAMLHLLSWLSFNARACLVVFVWAIVLPYAMRLMWRTLFWFADAGWAREAQINRLNKELARPSNTTTPSIDSALSLLSGLSSKLTSNSTSQPSDPPVQTPGPLLYTVWRWLFPIDMVRVTKTSKADVAAAAPSLVVGKVDSIYSNITVLRELTSSSFVNHTVIDVLEGLTITLSVVAGFILIFLIREWVVQQQPLVNMQFANANNAGPELPAQAGEVVPIVDGVDIDDPMDDIDDIPDIASDAASESSTNSRPTTGLDAQEPRDNLVQSSIVSSDRAERKLGPQEAVYSDSLSTEADLVVSLPFERAERVEHVITEWSSSQPESNTAAQLSNHGTDEPVSLANQRLQHTTLGPSTAKTARDSGQNLVANNMAVESWQDVQQYTAENEEQLAQPSTAPALTSTVLSNNGKGKARAFTNNDEISDFPPRTSSLNLEHNATRPSTWAGTEAAEIDAGMIELAEKIANNISSMESDPLLDGNDDDGDFENTIESSGDEPVAPRQGNTSMEETSIDVTNPSSSIDSDATTVATTIETQPRDQLYDHLERDTMLERLFDVFYGDLRGDTSVVAEPPDADDEQVVEDINQEAPFVPFADNQPAFEGANDNIEAIANPDQDPEVVAAAAQAGIDLNDPEAVEDAEDLEGILELIGMQGPLVGLFQNALFSAVLIAFTVSTAVWLPYMGGKTLLLIFAAPLDMWFKLPIRVFNAIEYFIADVALMLLGSIYAGSVWLFISAYRIVMAMSPFISGPLPGYGEAALNIATAAWERLGNMTFSSNTSFDSDYLRASVAAHESLYHLQDLVVDLASSTLDFLATLMDALRSPAPWTAFNLIIDELVLELRVIWDFLSRITFDCSILLADPAIPSSMVQKNNMTTSMPTADLPVVFWSAWDRAVTCLVAYVVFAVFSCVYVSWEPPLFANPKVRRVERTLVEILSQAGGVCKVILIISIEMMVFPLFCGFLLDLALLPLFDGASIASRAAYASAKPFTSSFMHWFVGTCYMFHFALFVSMCRKIMRSGVLYFIRDPDDDTFHPVRDVLERSVWTQLKKIAFSALVYGALIIVCLGGVVWGLWLASDNVLPLHWTSSKSAFEFPLDLLFYNFVTPLILKNTKPSDGLHAMYKWWFRRCARQLRLSYFLFGERNKDEEGVYFPDPAKAARTGKVNAGRFDSRSGRYVRAPSTDMVRIPRGEPTFVAVDRKNRRLDGKSETEGVHARDSTQTRMVYLPPWFKTRIGVFVLLIWLFAAMTGCGVTIVPLLTGRWMYRHIKLPSSGWKETRNINDIYAFSLGIYTLGTILYVSVRLYRIRNWAMEKLRSLRGHQAGEQLGLAIAATVGYFRRGLQLTYVYGFLAIGLPLALVTVLQLYCLIPLSSLQPVAEATHNATASSKVPLSSLHYFLTQNATSGSQERYTIHLVQDWTLGVLYTRIASRLLTLDNSPLLAQAATAVLADGGFLNPSARLATRYFIIPIMLAFTLIAGLPSILAWIANVTIFKDETVVFKTLVHRITYPLVALIVILGLSVVKTAKKVERWRGRIRDEVYLIGERLHNFGERRHRNKAVLGLGEDSPAS